MKSETSALLEKHHKDKKLQFIGSEKGLELEHSLTDEEKLELVQSEYGETLVGTVDDLFVRVMKNLVKKAREL